MINFTKQSPQKQTAIILSIITLLFAAFLLINRRGTAIFVTIYAVMLLAVVIISIMNKETYLHHNLFKYRWMLGILFLILAVFFELSGSSIGTYAGYLIEGTESPNTIFGVSRAIRSDEWAVNTPMMLSQYKNNFSYFSEIIRGTTSDTFIVYGQPALDIGIIFRPFHWGYLFFSEGRGLSFFWMGRLVALFLVTIEFAMLVTKRNKTISVAAAFLVAFAPVVQWWFAINGLVEMLIYGQLAILIIDKYMSSDKLWVRYLLAAAISICGGGYILTFYPAWMIPLFYVFAGLAIWIIITRYKKGVFSLRDIGSVAIIGIILGGCLGHVIIKSWDTIETVMNTAYPGAREDVGGGQLSGIFQGIVSMFLPYRAPAGYTNQCEAAGMFDFAPLGLILSLIVIFKQKKRDKLLIIMIIVTLFLGLYCSVGLPLWLAKITLLSKASSGRALMAVGFANILLLIRAISLLEIKFSTTRAATVSIAVTCAVMIFVWDKHWEYVGTIKTIVSIVFLIVAFIIVMKTAERNVKRTFCAMSIMIGLFAGATVNPIEVGVGVLTESELYTAVEKIAADDDGLWIVEDLSFPMSNIPMAAGARTINSTNVYPTLERWETLDVTGENAEIYNRYAHILVTLHDDTDTFFELRNADYFHVGLNVDGLKTLDVSYIISENDLNELSTEDVTIEEIGNYIGFNIFHVTYS